MSAPACPAPRPNVARASSSAATQRYKEESYEAFGGNFIEIFLQDIRFSLRVLRKSPGFTITAVLTLTLAIGANAVVFSVMNAFILHPLYVPQAESLYGIQHGSDNGFQSYPDYLDLRDRNHSFDGLAAFTFALAGLDTGNNPSATWLNETSGNYFDALQHSAISWPLLPRLR